MQGIKRLYFIILFLLFCNIGFLIAQTSGQWTWMKGDSIGGIGYWGVKGIPDTLNKPPALYESGNWIDLQGNFWIYGGDYGSEFGDLWKYDPVTNIWTWINGPGVTSAPAVYGIKGVPSSSNYPGARAWGMCTWTDLNGDLWLFGGYSWTNGEKNDLWKYNIYTKIWTWISGDSVSNSLGSYSTQGIPSVNNIPCSREEATTTWVDNSGNLWLFGGVHGLDFLNDLWKYNIATNEWTWMNGSNTFGANGIYGTKGISSPNNTPGARASYSHWKDINGNFWLFGGTDSSFAMKPLNDLWKYDIANNEWTWMSGSDTVLNNGFYGMLCDADKNNVPSCRWENKACWADSCGNFWMMGGAKKYSGGIQYLCDLWMYNPFSNIWTLVNGGAAINQNGFYGTQGIATANTHPGNRAGACSWLQNNGNLWIFGGDSDYGFKSDLWKYVPSCEGCSNPSVINQANEPSDVIEIFPNPVQNNFVIKLNSEFYFQFTEINIFNVLGEIIYSDKLTYQLEKINIDFTSGIYFVKVMYGEKYFCKKIIVDHN